VVTVSALLYTRDLDRVPAFLTLDEAHFSVHAHAIAENGRNLNGDLLPALISLEDPEGEPYNLPWGHTYYLPFGMYLIAGALQVLPLDESTVRLPSALLGGVINVGLIFAVALALLRDRLAATCAAVILALTPANVIISRQALDSVCQLPFTLGFLWCLGRFLQSPQPRLALAAGAILGLGIYAYVTSIVFMPFFLVVFWVFAWRAGVLDRRAWLWSIAGFAAALLPMVAWLAWHPDAWTSIREQYNRADPGSATLMQTIANGGITGAAREFIRIYWSYIDPSFLFVVGGNARNLSTGEAGVFLWPIAVLAPLGLLHLRRSPEVRALLVTIMLAAPIPAVIKGTPYQIQRASGLLIIISLLAGLGLAALWSSRRAALRALAAGLVVVGAWQFTAFLRDYHGDYRVRSSHAYDASAFGSAVEVILNADEQSPVPAVYLPIGLYDIGAKWRFYTTKHDRPGLWRATRYYEALEKVGDAHAGAMAVLPWMSGSRNAVDGWSTVREVTSLGGAPAVIVLRRD
jgi:4-amino-4-deoxy-L-arabinose transferase-like glycosyltransferase